MIQQNIYIDIMDNHIYESIFSKQYDSGRVVHFYITDNGTPLNSTDIDVMFEMMLPSNKYIMTRCTHIGDYFELVINNQITQYAGSRIPYQLNISKGSVNVRTITGYFRIESSVVTPEDIIEENYPNVVVLLNDEGKIDNDYLYEASTDNAGIVMLEDSIESEDIDKAATAHSVNVLRAYTNEQLDSKIPNSEKGSANGVAELDENGLILASQLPSFVDDVIEYNSFDEFPEVGESGKVYIDISTNISYRWGGTTYVKVASDLALGETSSTAYRGDRGKIAYEHSQEKHIVERELTLDEYNELPDTKYTDGVNYYIKDATPSSSMDAKYIGFDKTKTGLYKNNNVQDVLDHMFDVAHPCGTIIQTQGALIPSRQFGGQWTVSTDYILPQNWKFYKTASGNESVKLPMIYDELYISIRKKFVESEKYLYTFDLHIPHIAIWNKGSDDTIVHRGGSANTPRKRVHIQKITDGTIHPRTLDKDVEVTNLNVVFDREYSKVPNVTAIIYPQTSHPDRKIYINQITGVATTGCMLQVCNPWTSEWQLSNTRCIDLIIEDVQAEKIVDYVLYTTKDTVQLARLSCDGVDCTEDSSIDIYYKSSIPTYTYFKEDLGGESVWEG